MELWVRSQNKEKLIRVNNVSVFWENDWFIVANITNDLQEFKEMIVLGEYKSKQRALEILDEIQNILKPKMIVNTYKVEQAELCDGTRFIQPMLGDIQVQNTTSYVYKMPEE